MNPTLLTLFPGIACAHRDAEGHVAAGSYGFADREAGIAADAHTIFPACSISKFITALCLMKLLEQGLLCLDDPVNRHLSQWKLRRPDGSLSTASIRALMCHTAGIMDGEDAFYGLRQGDTAPSLLDLLNGTTAYNNRPAQENTPHGETFEYTDAGYCVLQLLIEEVTHKPFAQAAQEMIFAPLGLTNTFFGTSENTARFEARMATGYDGENRPLDGRFPLRPDLAASGLYCTAKDLLTLTAEFVAAYHGTSAFLTVDSARAIAAPAEKFPWTGHGVFREGDDILLSQGWGEDGQCMLKMHLRTGAIAVVMTNRNPEMDQKESGIEELADQLLQKQ